MRVLSLALIKSAQSDSVVCSRMVARYIDVLLTYADVCLTYADVCRMQVRKHTNRGEWQDFVNAHPDLREDLNDSKMAASPSHR